MNKMIEESQTLFQLKGSLFTLSVFQLLTADVDKMLDGLKNHIASTPKLFHNMPLVIDLQKVQRLNQTFDFNALLNGLRGLAFIPVGVRGGTTALNEIALSLGLAIMPANTKADNSVEVPLAIGTPASQNTSLVITKPVRSGQQIYAEDGDLIVLSSVSHGAEVLADGNIHIYGALHGRALAGVNNDENAHIFCQSLDAELVAIAGHYMVKDDLKKQLEEHAGFTHIYFANQRLFIEKI